MGRNRTFYSDDLSSFVAIKEHVVQAQMVLHYSGLHKSSDFSNYHKDLTSSEIGDSTIFALPDIFSFLYGTKNTSSSQMFTVLLTKVSKF